MLASTSRVDRDVTAQGPPCAGGADDRHHADRVPNVLLPVLGADNV